MIFICYRRDDTRGDAGRIFDHLARRFGENAVFRDVDTIGAGEDFRAVIRRRIEASRVLLVLIGPRWLDARDPAGRRRLHDADDLVRIEIATALTGSIDVIPVLLHGTAMPHASDLPDDLAALSSRHAIEIRDASFGTDVERLVRAIPPAVGRVRARRTQRVAVAAALAAAIALAVWSYRVIGPSAANARATLAQMNLAFDPDTFVKRAADGDAHAVALYLRAGMPPDAADRDKDTALMRASGAGRLDVVVQLTAKGADVDGALAWAVAHPAVLEHLLERRPGAGALDEALIAAARGHTAAMQRLLDAGANANAKTGKATPLIEAARMLNLEGVRALLARGAQVNPDVADGWLPLHHAVYTSTEGEREAQRLAVAEALVERGADLQARARSMVSWQPTPLLLAIDSQLPSVARFLIARGADVNAQTRNPANEERTALMWAAEEGLAEVVAALLEKGAAVDARNEAGETALIVAAGGTSSFGRRQPAVVRTLLAAGADPNAATKRGGTALIRAAAYDNGVVAILLEHGADVNRATASGWTALMVAAEYNSRENAALLLAHRADPKLRNEAGENALAIAVKERSARTAELLRARSASPGARGR